MAFKKLVGTLYLDTPRIDYCESCGKEIEPKPIETKEGIRYLDILTVLCPPCQWGEDVKAKEADKLARATERTQLIGSIPTTLNSLQAPFINPVPDEFTVQDKKMVDEIVEGMRNGKNYLMTSRVGLGKSYYASYSMRKLLEHNIFHPEWFAYDKMRRILLEIRKSFDSGNGFEADITRVLSRKRFLFLEISDHQTTLPKQKSEFASNTLFDIIDSRYLHWFNSPRKTQATLFVSTFTQPMLVELYDDSCISRIFDMCEKVFKLAGKNRRYKNQDKTTVVQI